MMIVHHTIEDHIALNALDHVWQTCAQDVINCIQRNHLPEDREVTHDVVRSTILDHYELQCDTVEVEVLKALEPERRLELADEVARRYCGESS